MINGECIYWNKQDNVELEEKSQPPSSSPIPLQTFPQKHFKRSLREEIKLKYDFSCYKISILFWLLNFFIISSPYHKRSVFSLSIKTKVPYILLYEED